MSDRMTDDAERSVLGSVLLDGRALVGIPSNLEPEDFGREAHGLVWEAIRALAGKSRPIDQVTLADELKAAGRLEAAGGPAYLLKLEIGVPHAGNVAHYAQIVRREAMRRRLGELGKRLQADAANDEEAVEDLLGRAQSDILALARPDDGDDAVPLRDVVRDTYEHLERLNASDGGVTGVPSGLVDLDRMLAGFQRGELTILAARPAVGKTALAVNNLAMHAADEGTLVVVFSLEMQKRQLGQRLFASAGDVAHERVRLGRLHADEWERVGKAGTKLAGASLWVRDRAGASLFDVRVACRRVQAKERRPIGLVVVDYVQIMRPTDRKAPREQQVAELARGLKELSKDLNCPVVALAQLSRELERRADKRPLLSDLRESGELEAAADVVIGMHREGLYDAKASKADTELIVLKNRHGPTGTVKAMFLERYTRFESAADERRGEWRDPSGG